MLKRYGLSEAVVVAFHQVSIRKVGRQEDEVDTGDEGKNEEQRCLHEHNHGKARALRYCKMLPLARQGEPPNKAEVASSEQGRAVGGHCEGGAE